MLKTEQEELWSTTRTVRQQPSSPDVGKTRTVTKSMSYAAGDDENSVPNIDARERRRGPCAAAVEAAAERGASCRRAAKLMISHDWFDRSVVGLILINCVFLALDDPTLEASTRTL